MSTSTTVHAFGHRSEFHNWVGSMFIPVYRGLHKRFGGSEWSCVGGSEWSERFQMNLLGGSE